MPSAFLLLVSAGLAQSDPQAGEASNTQEVGELRERVRLLEGAVDQLRGAADAVQQEVPLDLETRIHGYGSVNLNYLEENKVLGYAIDELVFQYTANLDRKMTVNTEFSLEAEEHGVDVGIEAMELGINVAPTVQVLAGAFHLPLSPWAVTASQGAYRYLPTAVPEALEEQSHEEYLPIDQTGLQVRGAVPVGFWQLSYDAAVTNGRAPDSGASPQIGDFNNFKALIGRVALQAPLGLQVGVGGYYDLLDVHDETLLTGEEDEDEALAKKTVIDDAVEAIGSASLVWQGGPIELHSEVYTTLHQVEGVTYQSWCGFAVVGVPIRETTPFLMADLVLVDPDDPIYQVYDQTGPELEILPGVRHELGLHLAAKAQAEIAYEFDSQSWGWGLQGQLAAGF